MRDTSDLYSWGGEDYDWHWNYTDFKDKTILDLGAEFGSSAAYFLKMGAKKVVCVDQDFPMTQALRWIFKEDDRVVSLDPRRIWNGEDFNKIFSENTCDICKIDIEGGETGLPEADPELVKAIPEFLIESHNGVLGGKGTKLMNDKLIPFFESLGYETKYCVEIASEETIQSGSVDVFYFRKK